MPDTDTILDDFFLQALQGLMDLARTTDKPHIKLRALLEIARLTAPSPAQRVRERSGRGWERATGLAPSPTPPIPNSASPSASPLRPSGAPSPSHIPPGGGAPPARRPRPLRGEADDRAIDRGSPRRQRSMPLCAVSSSTDAPPQSPPSPPPTPSSPSRSSCSTPEIDPIERTERIRMATQAREAIAINESRCLPVPKQWRAWATVDEGLHPPDTS